MNLKIFLTTYLDDQIKLKFLVEDNDGNISYKSSIMDVSDFLAENPVYILNDKLAISAIEVSTYTKNGQVNPYLILTCQNPAIPETPDNGNHGQVGAYHR